MLRETLTQALRKADDEGDECTRGTLRLVMTALKERDLCARMAGDEEGLGDAEIKGLICDMIAQRQEQIERCESSARLDLAEQEADEIEVLERFIPARMSVEEMARAIDGAIDELGATRLKDVGRVMSTLHERHEGQMDFTMAKRQICRRLG
ncbi:MAG: GatB/YqeY domain-containing protein, partial [Geminicoccaceae bacterium]|nr:GatB/YqeY domain-containing protein [Geminicoccaceae bacterium]